MDVQLRNHRTTMNDIVQVIHRCSGDATWFSRAGGYWCLQVDTVMDNAEITWWTTHGVSLDDRTIREAFRMNEDRWNVGESVMNGVEEE